MDKGQIYKRADSQWDWRIVNLENGQTIGTSGGQGFRDAHDARRALETAFPLLGVEELNGEDET